MRIKKSEKKSPFKLKSCLVALSLWGLSAVLTLSSFPVMAADTASNATQEQVARALFNKGVALDNLHRYEEALAAYNDFITRFENSQEMYIRDYVATALLSKSIDLEILHRHKEAIAAHDAISSYYPVGLLFNEEPYNDFQWWNGSQMGSQLAVDLLNKGKELTSLAISDNDLGNGYEEAITTYNELITRFENSHNTEIQEQVATALSEKERVFFLMNSPHYEEAIAVDNELITRFGNSQDTTIQEQVANALNNKGFDLGRLHRYEEAIATFNDLITRFGNSQDTKIQEQVAEALLSKGEDLDHLHRYKEALTVYNKLITGFGDSQYTMAKALLNEGNDLEILHRIGQARVDWKELVYRFKDNPYFIDQNAVAEARHNLSITKKEKTFFDRLSSLF